MSSNSIGDGSSTPKDNFRSFLDSLDKNVTSSSAGNKTQQKLLTSTAIAYLDGANSTIPEVKDDKKLKVKITLSVNDKSGSEIKKVEVIHTFKVNGLSKNQDKKTRQLRALSEAAAQQLQSNVQSYIGKIQRHPSSDSVKEQTKKRLLEGSKTGGVHKSVLSAKNIKVFTRKDGNIDAVFSSRGMQQMGVERVRLISGSAFKEINPENIDLKGRKKTEKQIKRLARALFGVPKFRAKSIKQEVEFPPPPKGQTEPKSFSIEDLINKPTINFDEETLSETEMQVVLDSASEKGGIIKVAPFVKHGKIPKNINSEIKEKWDFLKEAATLMISLEQKKNLPDEKDIQIFERLTERTHFDTEWQKLLMTPIIEHLANTNIEDIDLGLRKSLSENYGKLAILVYSYSEKDIPFHLDEKNIKEPISKNIGLLNREIKSINNGRNRKKRASKILKKIKDISKNINSINNNIDLLNDLSSIIKNIEETPGFIEKLSDEAFKDYEDIYDNLKKLISSDLAQNLPLMRIDNHIRAITNSQKELSDAQIYKRLTLITPPLPLNSMENLQTAVYLSKRLNTLKQNINIKNEQKEVLLACEEILWSQSIEFITNQMNSPNLPKEESNRLLELLSELLSSKSSLSYDILPKIRFIIKNINKKNIRNYKFTQKALTSISKNIKINNETKTNERAEVYCFLHQQQLELIKSLNKLLEEESKQSPINTNTTIEIMELLSEVTGMKESYEDKQPQNPLQAFQNSQPLRDEFIEKATSEDFDKNTARDNIGEAVTKTVELIKEIKNKILNEVTDEKTKILSPIRTLSYNIHVNQTKTLFASFGLSPLKYIGSFEEEKIEQEIQEYFTGFITKCDEYISEKNKSLILLEEKIEQETQEYFTGFIKKCDEDTSEKKKNLISLKEINTKLNLLYFFHENSGKYVLSETQLMVLKIIQNKIIDSFEENDTLEDKEAIKEISDKWNKILNPS